VLDVVYVALFTAFFALSLALVRACDRIVGTEPVVHVEVEPVEDLAA
jgi:hypothetical protein